MDGDYFAVQAERIEQLEQQVSILQSRMIAALQLSEVRSTVDWLRKFADRFDLAPRMRLLEAAQQLESLAVLKMHHESRKAHGVGKRR